MKDKDYRYNMIKSEFYELLDIIANEHVNSKTCDVDVAYRIQFKVIEEMDIVGKLTPVPIMDVILKQPTIEDTYLVYNKSRKFTIKERLKILFKGEI